MKKLISLFAIMLVAAMSYAQVGKVLTVTASEADTSKGAETDYIVFPNAGLSGQYDLTFQMLCTQTGGTSDGKVTLEASVDGVSYSVLSDEAFPDVSADSLTITNGAVLQFNIPVTHHYKYRAKIVGTVNDTTLFAPRYILKKIE